MKWSILILFFYIPFFFFYPDDSNRTFKGAKARTPTSSLVVVDNDYESESGRMQIGRLQPKSRDDQHPQNTNYGEEPNWLLKEREKLVKEREKLVKERQQLALDKEREEFALYKEREEFALYKKREELALTKQREELALAKQREELALAKERQQLVLDKERAEWTLHKEREKLALIKEASKRDEQTVSSLISPSNSEMGSQLLLSCKQEEGITDSMLKEVLESEAMEYVSKSESDLSWRERPILSTNELEQMQKELGGSYEEAELVALMTPTLLEIVRKLPDQQQLLINSESLKWIHTSSNREEYFQKPDLFICHRSAFVEGSEPAGAADAAQHAADIRATSTVGPKSYLFGRCVWQLREAVRCIIEAKRKKMTVNKAIGECFNKAQNLLRDSTRTFHKVMLFDANDIYLLKIQLGRIESYNKFKWTDNGSFVVLLNFFHMSSSEEPKWLSVLRSACSHFEVTLHPTNAFLGQGATGRVFRVYKSDTSTKPYALKVVEANESGEHVDLLFREVEQMTHLLKIPITDPVRRHLPQSCSELYIVCISEKVVLGAAAMFDPVGVALSDREVKRNESLWIEVCHALVALHAAGVRHGDPRLPNIVRVSSTNPRPGATSTRFSNTTTSPNTELIWIDFRTSHLNSPTTFEINFDCKLLLQSFFSHIPKEDSRFGSLSAEYQSALLNDQGCIHTTWCKKVWRELQDSTTQR